MHTNFINFLHSLLSNECNISDDDVRRIIEDEKLLNHFIYAFTDSSVNKDIHYNYEGYEFYGDSIVNATTKDFIFKNFFKSTSKIGDLSELENQLRSKPILAAYSLNLGLPAFAIKNYDVQINGKNNKTSLAEDLFESFVGALSVVMNELYPNIRFHGHNIASLFVYKQILKKTTTKDLQIGHLHTAKKRTIIKEMFQKARFGEVKYINIQSPNRIFDNNQPYVTVIELPSIIQTLLKKTFGASQNTLIAGVGTNYVLDLAKEQAAGECLIYCKDIFNIDTDFSEMIKTAITEMRLLRNGGQVTETEIQHMIGERINTSNIKLPQVTSTIFSQYIAYKKENENMGDKTNNMTKKNSNINPNPLHCQIGDYCEKLFYNNNGYKDDEIQWFNSF